MLGNNGTYVKKSDQSRKTGCHGNNVWVRTTFDVDPWITLFSDFLLGRVAAEGKAAHTSTDVRD